MVNHMNNYRDFLGARFRHPVLGEVRIHSMLPFAQPVVIWYLQIDGGIQHRSELESFLAQTERL